MRSPVAHRVGRVRTDRPRPSFCSLRVRPRIADDEPSFVDLLVQLDPFEVVTFSCVVHGLVLTRSARAYNRSSGGHAGKWFHPSRRVTDRRSSVPHPQRAGRVHLDDTSTAVPRRDTERPLQPCRPERAHGQQVAGGRQRPYAGTRGHLQIRDPVPQRQRVDRRPRLSTVVGRDRGDERVMRPRRRTTTIRRRHRSTPAARRGRSRACASQP
jgi:hypothetical protein